MQQPEYVILLHGIMNSKFIMRKLDSFLSDHGYQTLNINYPSTAHTLEELRDMVWQEICATIPSDCTMHFVGYSMGGIITRVILSEYRPAKLGRVVQLAPPNKGSEVADFWSNNWLYKTFFGPAGGQLITDQAKIEHLFAPIDFELGVIAGSRNLDPLSALIFQGPNDGKVSVESTKLLGMQDHITLKVTHQLFTYSKKVHRQTLHFLQHGKFVHSKS